MISMKVGDLVKMKYEMWWKLQSRKNYTHDIGIIYEIHGKGVKVLMPDGTIKLGLVDHYDVIT